MAQAVRELAGHKIPQIDYIEPGEQPLDIDTIRRVFAEAGRMMEWGASPTDAIKKCIAPGLTHLVEHVAGRQAAPKAELEAPPVKPMPHTPNPEIRQAILAALETRDKVRWDIIVKEHEHFSTSVVQGELAAMAAEEVIGPAERGWYTKKEG